MSKEKNILKKIQILKKYLNDLINHKNDLQDAEIISTSKLLDKILNDYDKIISSKNDT